MSLLKTHRLELNRFEQDDQSVFHQVYSDPVAVKWVGDGEPISMEECEAWINVTLNNYQRYGYGMYQVMHRETRQLVGCCGIVHPGRQPQAEIKYCLLRDYWGKGYATELVKGLVAFGQREFALSGYVATVAPENLASQRVLLKSGFIQTNPLKDEDGSVTEVFEFGEVAPLQPD